MPKSHPTKTYLACGALWHLHHLGWTDIEIAHAIGVSAHIVLKARNKMGLPDNAWNERRRREYSKRWRAKLRTMGVPTMADHRSKLYHAFAQENGWPTDLPMRCVQILNLLYVRGPMTTPELCEAIGVAYLSGRLRDRKGSYLEHLVREKLIAKHSQQRKPSVYSLIPIVAIKKAWRA